MKLLHAGVLELRALWPAPREPAKSFPVHPSAVRELLQLDAERIQADLLSDSVNLASRLEGLTKLYGASIVISEQTFGRLESPDRCRVRRLGKVKVKGKQQIVSVFEALDGNPPDAADLKMSTNMDFERGLSLYYEPLAKLCNRVNFLADGANEGRS